MSQFEYQVVPAPRRGEKARGVKTTPDRFARALSTLMNQMARDGWDYLRADTLPCDERVGLTGTKTTFQSMLVFRRALATAADADTPEARPALLLTTQVEGASAPALGAAIAPVGAAPALGSVKDMSKDPGLAAE